MITKEMQYRLYAGTSKDDYTGWIKSEATGTDKDAEYWSLDLGDGYWLDRFTKKTKGLLGTKTIRINSLRRDRTIADPEGDYQDTNFSMLFNVKIMISPEAIKFDSGNNSFTVLSREPADWEQFSTDVPKFDDDDIKETSWSSFYS